MESALVVFLAAAAASLGTTGVARAFAPRLGLMDRPDGRRKMQPRPVAVVGGLGVLAATVVTLVGVGVLAPFVEAPLLSRPDQTYALLAAAVLIAAVGLVDDVVSLRARYKIAGQLAAVGILVFGGGFVIDQVSVFGSPVSLGLLAVPVTAFWFLAAINALNLLDGMDGLLGTVGIIIFASLAWMAVRGGHPFAGWVAVATAGSLLGFLRYNLPPASVYLGDCGSMLIGLVVAALAIKTSLKGPAVAIVAPTALLVLPLIDTGAAIVRRKLTGRGLAAADRGHMHHEMLRRGLSRGRALGLIAVLGVVAAAGALAGTFLQNDLYAVVSAGVVAVTLLVTGLFGTAEVRLIKERASAYYRSATRSSPHIELAVRLQGTADWADAWKRLVRAADELRLQSLRLDVNAPAWQEGFHGRWDRVGGAADPAGLWRLELPVVGRGQTIGRISLTGPRADGTLADQFAQLSVAVAEVEAAIAVLGPAAPPAGPVPLSAPA